MDIIFGPVNSRRFGKSLGVDLSPTKKQCNFDCLYCELAPAQTVASYQDVLSVSEIISALTQALLAHQDIDVITLTANGEPTLYPHLEELIDAINLIKNSTKTLILSNGSTINQPKIQKALYKLDSVKLSLDCATNSCLKKLDRSHQSITIESIMQGMLSFKQKYTKPLIMETLFVKNINDKPQEIRQLNQFLLQLNPTRIDIGTIDRPPAYNVGSLSYEELYALSQQFDQKLPIYISSRKKVESKPARYTSQEIMQTLSKRPLSPEDIEILFDATSQEELQELQKEGKIIVKEQNNINFYIIS